MNGRYLKRSEVVGAKVESLQVVEIGQGRDVGESFVSESQRFYGIGIASLVVLQNLLGAQSCHDLASSV